MRARFEKLLTTPDRSFRIVEPRLACFDAPWHFHPEIELTLIVESRGRRFVGDCIEPFVPGDLVLLGPNLPHFWHNEGRQRRGTYAHAVVVQFLPHFLGPDLWTRPEFAGIGRMLVRAARGLHFSGEVARRVGAELQELSRTPALPGLLALWSILDRLASARGARPLASAVYAPHLDARAEERMARVYTFLMRHHAESLTLAQIAKVAAMTPVAFSRYFKRTAGRNVSDFLNDLRISNAAQQLRETTHSITRIAEDAGYPTLSNFFRRFRERFGCSPLEYRRDSEYRADVASPLYAKV